MARARARGPRERCLARPRQSLATAAEGQSARCSRLIRQEDMMKSFLLALNHGYLFFGTTLYVGVLWAMRFFWYPSWNEITLADVAVHFVGPTSRATTFFTIVVPLM